MIVNTMTLQEIRLELFKDLPALLIKLAYRKKEFRRKVLKASRFPCSATYEIKTGVRKNLFVMILVAKKKREANDPLLISYGIYDRPEGSYAAAFAIHDESILIYPPHFFKRYRERIVKDDKLSNKELIRLYFTKCWLLYRAFAEKGHEEVYRDLEGTANGEISFVGITEEGYCFGSSFGKVDVVKTIISEENIFDHKKALLHELREKYNQAKQDEGLETFTLG